MEMGIDGNEKNNKKLNNIFIVIVESI